MDASRFRALPQQEVDLLGKIICSDVADASVEDTRFSNVEKQIKYLTSSIYHFPSPFWQLTLTFLFCRVVLDLCQKDAELTTKLLETIRHIANDDEVVGQINIGVDQIQRLADPQIRTPSYFPVAIRALRSVCLSWCVTECMHRNVMMIISISYHLQTFPCARVRQ